MEMTTIRLGKVTLTGDRDHDLGFTRVRVDCNGGYTYISVSNDEWESLVTVYECLALSAKAIAQFKAQKEQVAEIRDEVAMMRLKLAGSAAIADALAKADPNARLCEIKIQREKGPPLYLVDALHAVKKERADG